MEEVSKIRCLGLWGKPNFEWAFRESEGRSRAILSIWNNDVFHMISSWSTQVSQNLDARVCLVGDFNAIRRPEAG
ncbi:hypothetical protein ACS0TY_004878 [Phlomoides rotata]